MKHIILLAGILFTCTAYSQKIKQSEVPAAVLNSLKQAYPEAMVEKWEKENNQYEAEIVIDKKETSLVFDANGTLVETETEIKVDELPGSIREYVVQKLDGRKIKEASKIVAPDGYVLYEVEVGGTDYIFDEVGKLLRQEKE